MKNLKTKLIISFILLIIMSVLFQTVSFANSTNFNDIIIAEKENSGKTEFIIYHKDTCKDEFTFAFSKNKDSEPKKSEYKKSAKDQNGSQALNVSYIDANIMTKDIFEDEPKTITYLWIKSIKDESLLLKGKKIDLKQALNKEKIDLVNNATNLIEIDEKQTNTEVKVEDGTKKTITTGKFVIKNDDGKYSYQLLSAVDKNSKAGRLYNLVELMKSFEGNTFEKLDIVKEFYDLYNDLKPVSDSEWQDVANNEILQPDGAVDGDKYVLWLKKTTDNEVIIDVKLLNCVRTEDEGVEKIEKETTEVVKSPVTYDSVTLFIVLGIIIIAIIAVLILKKINSKKEN